MRLRNRFISREAVLLSVGSYELIEEYPKDKYFPSCLVYAEYDGDPIHIHVAIDQAGDRVIIVTVYRPSRDKWEEDLRTRRNQ